MGLWGRLFGAEKALGGVVDGVSKGLDALVYTEEERASDARKERSEARAMVVGWMAATQGQNLARRLIALSITGVWLFLWLSSVAFSATAIFADTAGRVTAAKMVAVSEVARSGAAEMGPAVMLILAFYFAAPHMGDIVRVVTGRLTKKGCV